MLAGSRRILPILLALVSATAFARAKGKATLVLQVTPKGAQVFVDGHDMGKATAGRSIEVTSGFHDVRLVYKGDEREEHIKFEAGKKTIYNVQFDEGSGKENGGDDLDVPSSDDSP